MGSEKSEYWRTEEGLTLLEGWARDGLTYARIAEKAEVCVDTLREWRKRFPEVEAALKRGREIVDYQVEKALLKRALGYDCQETRMEETEKTGAKVIQTVKHVPGNPAAQMFWLKNRLPEKWRDKPEQDKRDRAPRDALAGMSLSERYATVKAAAERLAQSRGAETDSEPEMGTK